MRIDISNERFAIHNHTSNTNRHSNTQYTNTQSNSVLPTDHTAHYNSKIIISNITYRSRHLSTVPLLIVCPRSIIIDRRLRVQHHWSSPTYFRSHWAPPSFCVDEWKIMRPTPTAPPRQWPLRAQSPCHSHRHSLSHLNYWNIQDNKTVGIVQS